MAGNIKGITIEFQGDTTKLDRALRQIKNSTKDIDKELKQVDKALKFNPKNVDLWRQKQDLLKEKISQTEKNLESLKNIQAQMDAKNVDKQSEAYRAVQREIIATESKLKTFKQQLMQIGQANFRAVGEQFKEIGSKMEEAGRQAEAFSAVAGAALGASAKASLTYSDAIAKMSTIADESQVPVEELRKEILELSNQYGLSATDLAEAAYQALSASVETKEAAGFVEQAARLAKAGFLETADAVDVLTTIINAYGYEAKDATLISDQLVQTQNDGKTTVNELAQAMGQVIPTASALNIPLEQLNASYVALTKQGINTANATTYLNGMFTELADGGSGVSEILQNKTGKTFGKLMASGASLGDILQILSDSVNGDGEAFLNLWGNVRAGRGALALLNNGVDEFNAETEKMAGATGNVESALGKLGTTGAEARKALNMLVNAGIQIGDVLAPYIEKVAEAVQSLVEKFNNLSPTTKKIIVAILAIVAAISPLLRIGGKLMSGTGTLIIGVGKVIGVFQKLIPIITTVASVIGTAGFAFLGIAAIIGVAALAIYKHWDQIKAWAIDLATKISAEWTRIKTNAITQVTTMKNSVIAAFNSFKARVAAIWNGIKTAITTPIQTAVSLVKTGINKLKSIVNGAKLKLPKIKLPHFKISGKLSLNPPSIPKVSVSWYKQGGIFDSPTIAGIGEAGPEAVVPLDKFWEKLDNLQGETSITINIYGENADPKQIANEVRRMLIKEVSNRRMAWQ